MTFPYLHTFRDATVDGVCISGTYTHHSELQEITALSLISTLCKSPQHPLSYFPACCVFLSHSLATAASSGDSSASRYQLLSSQPPVQNSTFNPLLFTNSLTTDNKVGLPNCLEDNYSARTIQKTLFAAVTLLEMRIYRAVA
jgi:hypothetical protein